MRIMRFVVAACLTFWVGVRRARAAGRTAAAGRRGRSGRRPRRRPRGGGTPGQLIGGTGTVAMTPVDARGWGWQVKASVSPTTPRPFYNKAKELLFQDKQVTSYTISTFNPDLYCEVRKHFDFIWFEMQHSTMSWDEVRRMMLACPGVDGAAPMVRMPDALESSIQKATDIGAIGIIVPTVDDALEARDAARFSRYPPVGRRSSGGGSFGQVWPGVNYRATINDNMLVTVMIETLEGVANAEEIAATAGVDVDHPREQRSLRLLRLAAERPALSGCADQGPQRGAQVRQVLRQRRAAISERLCSSARTRAWCRTARHAMDGSGPRAAAVPVAAQRLRPAGAVAARARPRSRSR